MARWAVVFPKGEKQRQGCRRLGWSVPLEPGPCSLRCCACGMWLRISPAGFCEVMRRGLKVFCPFCAERRR